MKNWRVQPGAVGPSVKQGAVAVGSGVPAKAPAVAGKAKGLSQWGGGFGGGVGSVQYVSQWEQAYNERMRAAEEARREQEMRAQTHANENRYMSDAVRRFNGQQGYAAADRRGVDVGNPVASPSGGPFGKLVGGAYKPIKPDGPRYGGIKPDRPQMGAGSYPSKPGPGRPSVSVPFGGGSYPSKPGPGRPSVMTPMPGGDGRPKRISPGFRTDANGNSIEPGGVLYHVRGSQPSGGLEKQPPMPRPPTRQPEPPMPRPTRAPRAFAVPAE